MDFDLRDWLYILGAVLIVGVLVHGFWRMRIGRSELRMSLDRTFLNTAGGDSDELSMFKAELPNGGARVIADPEQTSLDLAQDVPVLMEPVEPAEPIEQADRQLNVSPAKTSEEPVLVNREVTAKAPPVRKPSEKPEKFVVVNVLSADKFSGQELLETLVDAGMAFGEMDIFHCHDADGHHEFSLVNAVEPGSFNMATMSEIETPGVTFFMRAHELHDPVTVYDKLIVAAQLLADELGGQLCDESRSVMTTQTIEHCRQSLREFQYKHSA